MISVGCGFVLGDLCWLRICVGSSLLDVDLCWVISVG